LAVYAIDGSRAPIAIETGALVLFIDGKANEEDGEE
jgi:hypothetical protein